MTFTMADHHKAMTRFIADSRDRASELQTSLDLLMKQKTKIETELNLMKEITKNGESFLNLYNEQAGGESAIVLPGNMSMKRG